MTATLAISETGNASLANEQIAAFLSDPETRELVHDAITDRWPNAVLNDGGLSSALGILSQSASPPALIVDVSGSDDPNTGIRSLMALCDPTTRVIAIGSINDISYYRELTALGVSDYLVKPFDPADLVVALDPGTQRRPVLRAIEPEESERDVISIVGARGGVGSTTVAVNMAWIASHELGQNCAIVDFDLQFGTVGLQLDLEPSHGLREALENPDRIDALFIASAMTNESENLFVLSAEESFEENIDFSPVACETLIEALPEDLRHIFIDVPARSVVENPAILKQSNKIVLVSDPSLAGMRDVSRLARLCQETVPDAALHTVVNKMGMAGKHQVPKSEFAKSTELPVSLQIPYEPKIVAASAISGKPLPVIARRSQSVKALRKLAQTLVRSPADKSRTGGLSALRSLLSGNK